MDLSKIRILLDVIRIGSISKASEECGYTISGISRMITALEKEIGVPLLYRKHDGVIPTRECELLLPHLRELLFHEEIVLQTASRLRSSETGDIKIGIAYSSYYPWISKKISAFRAIYPDIQFEFINDYTGELLSALSRHELDLCLISQRDEIEEWYPLGEEELVAWVPSDHPLAKENSVPLTVFETEKYIDVYPGKDIDNARVFQKNNIHPNVTASAEDNFAVYSMVEAGLGITMNHRSNAAKWSGDVTIISMDPYIAIPVGLATTKIHTPIVDNFWKFCKG